MLSLVLGVVAAAAMTAFAVMVVMAGGWRGLPRRLPAIADQPGPRTPQQQAFALRWQAAWVTELLRIALLVIFGLTPVGAGFVHLLAPGGNVLLVALAWMIMAAAVLAVSLAGRTWRRRAMSLVPDLYPAAAATPQRWRNFAGWLESMLALMLIAVGLRASPGTFLLLVTLALPLGAITTIRQPQYRRLPPSPQLAAVLDTLAFTRAKRTPVAVVGWRGRNLLANAVAVDGLMPNPMILVAPPLMDSLDGRELRAVIAHELAHVLHRDPWRRLTRLVLCSEAALATAVALSALPAVRHLAGLPAHLDWRVLPFLVAVSYLMFRLLLVVNLHAARAEEVAADARARALTGDPGACADAISRLGAMLGSPGHWTFGQHLLVATHPSVPARLTRLAGPLTTGHPADGTAVPAPATATVALPEAPLLRPQPGPVSG
ncbi:MAG TPA: M48 family metalloprotease [Streptosporangiaceae bacterium]